MTSVPFGPDGRKSGGTSIRLAGLPDADLEVGYVWSDDRRVGRVGTGAVIAGLVAVVAGCGGGATVTVTRTVQAKPPAYHSLEAVMTAPGFALRHALEPNGSRPYGCFTKTSPFRYQGPTLSDTWTLRNPDNNKLLAIADEVSASDGTCGRVYAVFSIRPNIGFFNVSDDTAGVTWGPFESSVLPASRWRLALTYNG